MAPTYKCAGRMLESIHNSGPELVPLHAEVAEQSAQCGEGQADDGVGIPVNGGDEGCAEGVDGERSGDVEWLAGGDVGVELGVADAAGEGDVRAGDGSARSVGAAASVVDEPVTGVEGSGAASLQHPPFARDVGGVGFAVDDPVEFEGGVAAEDEPVNVGGVVS